MSSPRGGSGPPAEDRDEPGREVQPAIVEDYDLLLEVFPLPTDESTLLALLTELFERWWDRMLFGVLVQGAAWEISAPNPPEKIAMYDGYVTIDFGRWHLHLCIGEHTASGPELGRLRRCRDAFLYRSLAPEGEPVSWGVRLLNGEGTQMLNVLLPNPFLSDQQQPLQEPDWERLACWDLLRDRFLGLGPDPRDRQGTRFVHT